jgi:hypothetical protein
MKNLDILEELLNETKQKQKKLKSGFFSSLFQTKENDPKKLLKKL